MLNPTSEALSGVVVFTARETAVNEHNIRRIWVAVEIRKCNFGGVEPGYFIAYLHFLGHHSSREVEESVSVGYTSSWSSKGPYTLSQVYTEI